MRERAAVQVLIVIGERFVYLLPAVVLILLITRLLGSEFFGKYSLVLTWTTAFQLVASFGITECLAREIGREPEHGSRSFSQGLVISVSFGILATVIMVVAVLAFRYPSDVTAAILLGTLILLPANIIATCRGVALACKRAEVMLGVGAAEGSVLLVVNGYLILNDAGLMAIVGTIVVAKGFAALLTLFLVHRRVMPIRSLPRVGEVHALWRILLPFGIAGILAFPSIQLDLLLMSKFASLIEVGIYFIAIRILQLSFIVPLAFFMVSLPRAAWILTRERATAKTQLENKLGWYFALVAPLAVAGIVFAEPFISFVFGAEFLAATLPLRLLMVALVLLSLDVPLAMICKAAGHQRTDLIYVLVTNIASIVFFVTLIPSYGAVGAAVAQILAISSGVTLRWLFVRRSVIRLDWLRLLRLPLCVSLTLGFIFGWLMHYLPWFIAALGFVTAYLAYVLFCVYQSGDFLREFDRRRKQE